MHTFYQKIQQSISNPKTEEQPTKEKLLKPEIHLLTFACGIQHSL